MQTRIVEALRRISPHDLQVLAEEMAIVKFPKRFGVGTLLRTGRNSEGQTTKGWPDAYVFTATNEVDGIEATRENQNWSRHLKKDVENAQGKDYYNLSGYFFVGGYPDHAPTAEELKDWIGKFAALGIPRASITLLIGRDLVAELSGPQYARIRQVHLGIASAPACFQLMGTTALVDKKLGLFQPTQDEFSNGRVAKPKLFPSVLNEISSNKCALIRGLGAAGKTTLAQLVSRDPLIAPHPAWYLDIAHADSDNVSDLILNELVELSAEGVLFVIDNVHLNEHFVLRVLDHWRQHGSSIGARLLMLGREIQSRKGAGLGGIRPLILRAGYDEMRAVVMRLYSRKNDSLNQIPQEVMSDWARTFGGNDNPDLIAVDLIAFTAAVDSRIDNFILGDFRLAPTDAVEAVRARYLKPMHGTPELENLLLLAALAEFEIGLYDELFADQIAGLSKSINELGLVVCDVTGLEQRQVYSLVHAALGKLLLEAARPNFDMQKARLGIARKNPAVGFRMLARKKYNDGLHKTIRDAIKEQCTDVLDKTVREAIETGEWPQHVFNLYDFTNIVRIAIRNNIRTAAQIDYDLQNQNALVTVVNRTRSLAAINSFLSWAQKCGLTQAVNALGDIAQSKQSSLIETIYCSKASNVVSLIRAHPNGSAILANINTDRWSVTQKGMSPELAADTVAAGRFFEAKDRAELATEPAAAQVRFADSSRWVSCDLSHLSHILRFANSTKDERRHLLTTLASTNWLQNAYEKGLLGPLCGAVLSLSNYLDADLREIILTPDLQNRLFNELERTFSSDIRIANRPIGLLGGYTNLGGELTLPKIVWEGVSVEWMIQGLCPKHDDGSLGTYELQFWLGLMALSQVGSAPEKIQAEVGEKFISKLENSKPPTPHASITKGKLIKWLHCCRNNAWNLNA